MSIQKLKLTQNTLYAVVRFWQRLTLLATLLVTFVYWVVLIFTALNAAFSMQAGLHYKNVEQLNTTINTAMNRLSFDVLHCAIGAAVVTLLLLAFRRVRTDEKRLIIDSAAVLVFCIGATMFAQMIIRNFVSTLG